MTTREETATAAEGEDKLQRQSIDRDNEAIQRVLQSLLDAAPLAGWSPEGDASHGAQVFQDMVDEISGIFKGLDVQIKKAWKILKRLTEK